MSILYLFLGAFLAIVSVLMYLGFITLLSEEAFTILGVTFGSLLAIFVSVVIAAVGFTYITFALFWPSLSRLYK